MCHTPNALLVTGTAYFADSFFEALSSYTPGGGLIWSQSGAGEQTFERVEVNQLYPHIGVLVQGGWVVIRDSWIPRDGFESPNVGVMVVGGGSASVENTRVRGSFSAILFGYVESQGPSPADSLTVSAGSDIQSSGPGIDLYLYTGSVLVEDSNIHGSYYGIVHEDDNADGTALIVGNTIEGNYMGIRVSVGRPDIRDNTIQSNQVGISIMGGAPHIYGDAGAGNGNVITGNTQYGIYIAATADADCSDGVCVKVEWNDIYGNFGNGIEAENPYPTWGDYFDGRCNWWNSDQGPDDPSPGPPGLPNPNPNGESISDYVYYRQWLDGPMDDPLTTCSGG